MVNEEIGENFAAVSINRYPGKKQGDENAHERERPQNQFLIPLFSWCGPSFLFPVLQNLAVWTHVCIRGEADLARNERRQRCQRRARAVQLQAPQRSPVCGRLPLQLHSELSWTGRLAGCRAQGTGGIFLALWCQTTSLSSSGQGIQSPPSCVFLHISEGCFIRNTVSMYQWLLVACTCMGKCMFSFH